PGSLFGAALAGLFFRMARRPAAAVAGEIVGTGILGAMVAFPVARWLVGHEVAAWFFYIVPFTASSAVGAVVAWFILRLVPAAAEHGPARR
ncbi:MAG TPA: energy coupling factor transporter S component ThiW, partial [Thermaerobacter sp.]